MSKKSAAVGTGAIAFSPLVDILEVDYGLTMAMKYFLSQSSSSERTSKFCDIPTVLM